MRRNIIALLRGPKDKEKRSMFKLEPKKIVRTLSAEQIQDASSKYLR